MSTSVSLRKTMRRLPVFTSLSGRTLDAIIAQMICQEYKPGEVLWRTGHDLDFLGIIQSGEIIVEYRFHGQVVRSVTLQAGKTIEPHDLKAKKHGESLLARASTKVRLYALRKEQITEFQLDWLVSRKNSLLSSPFMRVASWAFTAVTAITILLLGWQDLSRILSGSLFLFSEQVLQFKSDYQSTMQLLKYAEVLDKTAAFPHAKEGLIWYSQDNFEHAEASFLNAVNADLSNGPALNNLAVTYFTRREFHQALSYQQRAAQANPDNTITHYNLGLLFIQEDDLPNAIREFKEASYIDPTWGLPYKQRAYIYLQMRDYPSAEKEAGITIRLIPDDQASHVIHAIALYNQGKDQNALEAIENAIEITPEDEISRFYKALILVRLNNFDESLLLLQQLLDESNDPQQISRITAEINGVQRSIQSTETGSQ